MGINDYSEVTSTLPARVAKLSDELSRKNWKKSMELAIGIAKDMFSVIVWICKQVGSA